MPLVVDAFATWLIEQIAEAARSRLVQWAAGSGQDRALRAAAKAAAQRTAADLRPESDRDADSLVAVIGELFSEPSRRAQTAGSTTLLEQLQAGIADQLAPLDDASLTGAGVPAAESLGIAAAALAELLSGHLMEEILSRGAGGGPLAPLASQLNHDVTHLQVERTHGMLAEVLEYLARLGDWPDAPDAGVAACTLPPDVPWFTGRHAELERLRQALPAAGGAPGVIGISAVDGMAGIGKTAFAVHAAHHLAADFPDGQLFLRLHAHTPRQRPVKPADALATLLVASGVAPQRIPRSQQHRENLWRNRVAGRKMLLVLDDVTGTRQIRPLLPGTAGTLVLITSRHRLPALPEALSLSLEVLEPAEAASMLTRIAGRAGLLPGDAAVARIVRACGRLPLAIGLVAGQLKHHRTWTAEDMAERLESAPDRLPVLAAEADSVAASFQLSYQHLRRDQRRLFRRLALHPGTDIDAYAAVALDDTGLQEASRLLEELYSYHLIDQPRTGRYRFHDLVSAHALALADADPPSDRAAATDRLLRYYLYTAQQADLHLARRTATRAAAADPHPAFSPVLATPQQAVAWMEAERHNLITAIAYAAEHARPGQAIALAAAMHGFLRNQGHWDQARIAHRTALTAAEYGGDWVGEAGALSDLGDIQRAAGDYPAATTSLTRALGIFREIGHQAGEATALTGLGAIDYLAGNYPAATTSLTRALELHRAEGDQLGEATALDYLGTLQEATGDLPAAAASLTRALWLYQDLGRQVGEASALNHLGIVQQVSGDHQAAMASQARAASLNRDLGDRLGEANALSSLSAVQRDSGDLPAAMISISRALELYRDVGVRHGEANALNHLGTIQAAMGDQHAAIGTQEQALAIYREFSDEIGEATALKDLGIARRFAGDIIAANGCFARALALFQDHNDLVGESETLTEIGELSLAAGQVAQAFAAFEQALAIATRIPSPPQQARALDGIGRCQLH